MIDSRKLSLKEQTTFEEKRSTHLDLSIDYSSTELRIKDPQEIIDALQTLPEHIISLDFSSNYHCEFKSKVEVKKIIEVFSAIPPHIVSLNLSKNFLGFWLNKEELLEALKSIKANPNLKELDLSMNCLDKTEKWIEFFLSCQQNLEVLNLSGNFLGQDLSSERLIELFKSIRAPIKSLNLNYNCFHNRYCNHNHNFLGIVGSNIPKTVTTLSLKCNAIGRQISFTELDKIPEHIIKLDLSENPLVYSSTKTLGIGISKLKHITFLNLSNCDLSVKGFSGLSTIFTMLRENIISLDLSYNGFCHIGTKKYSDSNLKKYEEKSIFEHPIDKIITTDDFVRAFTLIPKQIKMINLSHNGFDNRKESELINIINAIPETVETIIVEENSKMFNLIQLSRNHTYNNLCESLPPEISATIFSYITSGHTFWNKNNKPLEMKYDDSFSHLKLR